MEKISWTTTYETASNIMTHIFEYGHVMATTDQTRGIMFIQKDKQKTENINVSTYSIEEYTALVTMLAESDKKLEDFSSKG